MLSHSEAFAAIYRARKGNREEVKRLRAVVEASRPRTNGEAETLRVIQRFLAERP